MNKNNIIKEKCINDWGLAYNTDYPSKVNKNIDNERSSFSVKLCPTCSCVYENKYHQYKSTVTTHRYRDFPTIGLRRENCLKCK